MRVLFLLITAIIFTFANMTIVEKNADNLGFVDDITINGRDFDSLPQEIEFYPEDLQNGKVVIGGILESNSKDTPLNALHVEITTDGGKSWRRAKGGSEWEWSFTPQMGTKYRFSLRIVKDVFIDTGETKKDSGKKILISKIAPNRIQRGEARTLTIRGEGFTPKTVLGFGDKDISIKYAKYITPTQMYMRIETAKNSVVDVDALLVAPSKKETMQKSKQHIWFLNPAKDDSSNLKCEDEEQTQSKVTQIDVEPKSYKNSTPVVIDSSTSQQAHSQTALGYIPFLDDQTILRWNTQHNVKPQKFIVHFFTPDMKEIESFTFKDSSHLGKGTLQLSPNQLYQLYSKVPKDLSKDTKGNIEKEKLLYYTDKYVGARFLFWMVEGESKIHTCKGDKVVKVAKSEFNALRMGKAPTGTVCDAMNKTLTATKIKGHEGEAFYPGDELQLYGEFSLENSPWQPNNLIIDWGDGTFDEKELKDYNRDAAIGCEKLQYDDFNCVLDKNGINQMIHLKSNHVYSEAGRFKIRVYVLPKDELSKASSIAKRNRKKDESSLSKLEETQKPNYYAMAGNIASDASKRVYPTSQKSLDGAMKKFSSATDRIFEVYCNPLDIFIVKDPDATGPLSLESIKISGYSSDDAVKTFSDGFHSLVSQTTVASKNDKGVSGSVKTAYSATKSDTVISACEPLLLSKAELSFHGQGYVRISWIVDGVKLQSTVLPLGPSSIRENLNYADSSSWPPPINDKISINSPRLPIKDIGKHKIAVEAVVVADPTASKIDTVAMKMQSATLKKIYDIKPLSSSAKNKISFVNPYFQNLSKSKTSPIKYAKPFFVKDEGSYEVKKSAGGKPCLFKYPIENGKYLKVFSLKNLKKKEGAYSGDAKVSFRLANSLYGVGEYFVPIHFENWRVDKEYIVTKGELKSNTQIKIDNLPGIKATLKSLSAKIAQKADATLDIEISDTSLYTALSGGKGKTKVWKNLKAPLTFQGDWYIQKLRLPLTRIGWSLFNIDSNSVAIDLNHHKGRALCESSSGVGWIGLDLGEGAKLYPYTFGLANDISFGVNNWGIDGSGLCGKAKSKDNFKHVFGDGYIGWKSLSVQAKNHNLEANYKGFYVDLAWPKVRLEGGDVKLDYKSQAKDEAKVDINFDISKELHESYGAAKLYVKKIKSFEKRGYDWGISTESRLSFLDRDGKNNIDVDVNDMFFTIFSTVGFGKDMKSQKTVKLKNQTIDLGGANVNIENALLKAYQKHGNSKKLDIDLGATIALEKWSETDLHLGYELKALSKSSLIAHGPSVSKFKPVSRSYPETEPINRSKMDNLKYIPKASKAQIYLPEDTYYASLVLDDDLLSRSGAGITDFPLYAGLNANLSSDDCSAMQSDTFSAHINTSYFGGGSPLIEATFRYGTIKGKSYWLFFSEGDFNPGISIVGPVMMYMIRGGAVWRFDPDDLVGSSGCNATPKPNYGLGLAFGVGLTIGGEDVVKIESTMVINKQEKKVGFYGIKGELLKILEIKQGKIEYVYGSHFQATLGTVVKMPKGSDTLIVDATNGKDGKIDLKMGGDYYLHIGTKDDRIKGKLLKIKGDMYLMIGTDTKGLEAGLSAYFGFNSAGDKECTKSLANCASIGVDTNAEFELHYDPFSFLYHSDEKFGANACIKLGKFGRHCIGGSISGYVDMGCCDPVKLAGGGKLDFPSPLPDVGIDVGIIPLGFDVDIHW